MHLKKGIVHSIFFPLSFQKLTVQKDKIQNYKLVLNDNMV